MTELVESLPVMHRLALAYAPRPVRDATLALFALDSRLAEIVRSASEPMLAQIRLAWWRDMLARDAAERPHGEPLVGLLQTWRGHAVRLTSLVDGWEQLASEDSLGRDAMRAFCKGRATAFAALAQVVGRADSDKAAHAAGEGWALADLASRLDNPHERESALQLVSEHDWRRIVLPRDLRPLAMLHGLAAHAGRTGAGLGSGAAGSLLLAVRIGLFGR